MPEQPNLTPEHFEILALRELRKAGLSVSELSIHRRITLPEPERGYLLELKGAVSLGATRRTVLIACWRQDTSLGRAALATLDAHVREAGTEGGILFGAAPFEPDVFGALQGSPLVLLRITDGRTAFDTSGWGAPGHYPSWLPAYCAQALTRDPMGALRYELLEPRHGERILGAFESGMPRDREAAQPRDSGTT
jgi:hypothetical protein